MSNRLKTLALAVLLATAAADCAVAQSLPPAAHGPSGAAAGRLPQIAPPAAPAPGATASAATLSRPPAGPAAAPYIMGHLTHKQNGLRRGGAVAQAA
ncbi:MAG: hypothetical protein ACK4MV_04155, partial [Beijerinckiaceae bacterium]